MAQSNDFSSRRSRHGLPDHSAASSPQAAPKVTLEQSGVLAAVDHRPVSGRATARGKPQSASKQPKAAIAATAKRRA
ncbi:MAG: hypothetical protein R2724_28280 [Bryobacterales bacterium]